MATEAQYLAEFNNLRNQPFWNSLSNEQLRMILAQAVAAQGGSTSDASAANQIAGNTSLGSIDTKTPTVGQKLAAASSPVVIASDNIITLKTDQSTHGTTDRIAADNVQINGAAIATGLGVANAGSQRIAVANDSRLVPWDGTTTAAYKAASNNPATGDSAEVVTLRPVVTSQDMIDKMAKAIKLEKSTQA